MLDDKDKKGKKTKILALYLYIIHRFVDEDTNTAQEEEEIFMIITGLISATGLTDVVGVYNYLLLLPISSPQQAPQLVLVAGVTQTFITEESGP